MKIRLVMIIIAVCAFASAVSAQRILGGYKDIETTAAGVQEAADFAVSAEAAKTKKSIELISISKAERQSVAGSNFRLCLKVKSEGATDEADAIIFVQAVVSVNLQGVRKLTSWKTSDCGEDDDDGNLH